MFVQGVKTGILLLLKNSKVSKAFIYTQDLCLVFVHIGCAVDGQGEAERSLSHNIAYHLLKLSHGGVELYFG